MIKKYLIKEIEFMPSYSYKSDEVSNIASKFNSDNKYRKIGKVGTHTYYTYDNDYYAVNNTTGMVDMKVTGTITAGFNSKGERSYHIGMLSGRQGSSLKADEFYVNIMKLDKLIIHTDMQSQGGRKTWMKLGQKKDVTVHAFDPPGTFTKGRGKGVNLNPADEDDTEELYTFNSRGKTSWNGEKMPRDPNLTKIVKDYGIHPYSNDFKQNQVSRRELVAFIKDTAVKKFTTGKKRA